jgi:hypothetical protein
MACVWPDQLDRLRLLRAALEVAKTEPPLVKTGDAIIFSSVLRLREYAFPELYPAAAYA